MEKTATNKLVRQTVTVKVISDRVMLKYEMEDDAPLSFILSNAQARKLAGLLKLAADATSSFTSEIEL